MSDYDWKDRKVDDLRNGFPEWAIGYQVWREYLYQQDDGQTLWRTLNNLWSRPGSRSRLKCPRVFISHKQCDDSFARRVAWITKQQGFDYWLDVEDSLLTSLTQSGRTTFNNRTAATILACLIEMALLNCTHVVAVISPATQQSRWVAYEFGRVKDNRIVSLSTCSWIHPSVSPSDIPEYLHLGRIAHDRAALEKWLYGEMLSWVNTHKCCQGGSTYLWKAPEPEELPCE